MRSTCPGHGLLRKTMYCMYVVLPFDIYIKGMHVSMCVCCVAYWMAYRRDRE